MSPTSIPNLATIDRKNLARFTGRLRTRTTAAGKPLRHRRSLIGEIVLIQAPVPAERRGEPMGVFECVSIHANQLTCYFMPAVAAVSLLCGNAEW